VKATCALCGRPTEPAVMIGPMAVGPKSREKVAQTLDLFAEIEEQT
jgi:hypothetical protein